MQKYLAAWQNEILENEKHYGVDVPSRHRFNTYLKGGKYVGHGANKCVLDDETPVACTDQQHNPVKPGEVQVVLPLQEVEFERTITTMLLTSQDGGIPFSPELLAQTSILIQPSTFVCKVASEFPEQKNSKGEIMKNCGLEWEPEEEMRLAILPKAEPFNSSDPNTTLDIIFILWLFNLNNMFHGDIKDPNLMTLGDRGVVIDVGFANTWQKFERYPDITKDTFLEKLNIMEKHPYPYWPLALHACLYSFKTGVKVKNARAVFDAVDKHAFVVNFLMNFLMNQPLEVGIEIWDAVKTQEEYDVMWPPGHPKQVAYDMFPKRTFKSWQEIYKIIFSYLKPSNRPAELSMDYWSQISSQKKPDQPSYRNVVSDSQSSKLPSAQNLPSVHAVQNGSSDSSWDSEDFDLFMNKNPQKQEKRKQSSINNMESPPRKR